MTVAVLRGAGPARVRPLLDLFFVVSLGLLASAAQVLPTAEMEALLRSDETRKRLESEGADVIRMTPPEFSRFIAEEIVKWGKVVKQAGITAE